MITLKETTNPEDVTTVLTDPEMWSRISEFGQDVADFIPVFCEGQKWLGLYKDDGEVIGVYCLQQEGAYTVNLHINILQQYRNEYAIDAGYLLLEYILLETTYEKIHAQAPKFYKEVVGFAVKFGFTVEGLSRKSSYRNGKMVDQFNLGITRAEIRRWLEDNYREK